MSDDVLEPIPS